MGASAAGCCGALPVVAQNAVQVYSSCDGVSRGSDLQEGCRLVGPGVYPVVEAHNAFHRGPKKGQARNVGPLRNTSLSAAHDGRGSWMDQDIMHRGHSHTGMHAAYSHYHAATKCRQGGQGTTVEGRGVCVGKGTDGDVSLPRAPVEPTLACPCPPRTSLMAAGFSVVHS
jgi:hypothetical protein